VPHTSCQSSVDRGCGCISRHKKIEPGPGCIPPIATSSGLRENSLCILEKMVTPSMASKWLFELLYCISKTISLWCHSHQLLPMWLLTRGLSPFGPQWKVNYALVSEWLDCRLTQACDRLLSSSPHSFPSRCLSVSSPNPRWRSWILSRGEPNQDLGAGWRGMG